MKKKLYKNVVLNVEYYPDYIDNNYVSILKY